MRKILFILLLAIFINPTKLLSSDLKLPKHSFYISFAKDTISYAENDKNMYKDSKNKSTTFGLGWSEKFYPWRYISISAEAFLQNLKMNTYANQPFSDNKNAFLGLGFGFAGRTIPIISTTGAIEFLLGSSYNQLSGSANDNIFGTQYGLRIEFNELFFIPNFGIAMSILENKIKLSSGVIQISTKVFSLKYFF